MLKLLNEGEKKELKKEYKKATGVGEDDDIICLRSSSITC